MLYLWGLLGSDKEINSKGPVISYVERGGGGLQNWKGAGRSGFTPTKMGEGGGWIQF